MIFFLFFSKAIKDVGNIIAPQSCMHQWMYVCMYLCMHECIYVCLYVCIYVCINAVVTKLGIIYPLGVI